MSPVFHPTAALIHKRPLSASPRQVFAAFENPAALARWWGPSGFTNTFEEFDFRPGGRWLLIMHGPDGANYANESIFREIQPDRRIVIEHASPHWFRLTVTLTPSGDRTHLRWEQEFENPEVAEQLRTVCEPANEQNLDRLEGVLSGVQV
jgi:uncharacterized protein YndB with AHSA1/START domain